MTTTTDPMALKVQRLQLAKNALYAACKFNSTGFEVDENNRAALVLISHWLIGEAHTELFDDGQGSVIPMEVKPPKGILLYGGVGTGKTAMMRAVSYARVKGGGSGFMITNAIRVVKEYNQGGDDGGDGVILRYANSPELCIDDLGSEEDGKHYGKITNVISDIIALRYEARRPTHFSTNSDMEALQTKYDVRALSRINEMATVVPLGGVDRRATASRVAQQEPLLFMPEAPMPTDEEIEAKRIRTQEAIAGLYKVIGKPLRVVAPEAATEEPRPAPPSQKDDLDVFARSITDLPDDRLELRSRALITEYGAESIAAKPFLKVIAAEQERRKHPEKQIA